MSSINFDKLYFIDRTGDQNEDISKISCLIKYKADNEFFRDLKDLPSPSNLPKRYKENHEIRLHENQRTSYQ